jgi:hypothetical protein
MEIRAELCDELLDWADQMPLQSNETKLFLRIRIIIFSLCLLIYYAFSWLILSNVEVNERIPAISTDQWYLIFIMMSGLLIIWAAHPHTLATFKREFNPDNNLEPQYYIRLGNLVIITSHHEGEFKLHEILIGGKMVCSGCLGMIMGLILGGMLYPIGKIHLITGISTQSSLSVISILVLSWLYIIASFYKYACQITGRKRLFLNLLFPIGIWHYFLVLLYIPYPNLLVILLFIGSITLSVLFRLSLMSKSHSN